MSDEGNNGCFKMKIIEYHDYKTLLGPCFISFSIPLLVPGVVLTVVGSYGNESSFPTFGAWHIIGISILSFAVLLLISGIVLKCCYKPVISADIEQHLSPTSSMITGSKNLGYENDIYSSNSAKVHNKVSHHDTAGSHHVVSTHEAKTTNNVKGTHKHFIANAVSDEKRTKTHRNQRKETQVPGSSKAPSVKTSNDASQPVVPPPSYEEFDIKPKRKKKPEPIEIPESNFSTSATTRAMQGQLKVTANIVAEAETVHSSRDLSSDGGTEQTTFLPEKKRKKKKRRKRHSNLSQHSQQSTDGVDSASGEASSRQVLPEVRAPPALIHDGEHHHHNLHVHFQEKEEVSEAGKNTEEVPDPAVYDEDKGKMYVPGSTSQNEADA